MLGDSNVDEVAQAQSLAEVVRHWARRQADSLAFRFLVRGLEHVECMTYAELDARASARAAALREHAGEGERALLMHEPGLDFVVDFVACQYAGVIPVPVQPPGAINLELGLARVFGIARNATPRAVLTSPDVAARVGEPFGKEIGGVRWLVDERGEASEQPCPSAEIPALLQYTSGSTATPRGVVVGQTNLLANLRAIRSRFGHDRTLHGVTWLPAFHDMGLIGMLLQPLYVGGSATIMTPLSFLRRPAMWLEAISRFGAMTSGAPNFGYELCMQRISAAELSGIDLSCWRVAFCGAEPIRHEVLSAFAAKFARCGFDESALLPCYGMAEATLMVSGARMLPRQRALAVRREALDRGRAESAAPDTIGSTWITNCGPTIADHELRIVDGEGVELEPGSIGEIWLRGPSVANRYWNDPEASHERFGARTREGEGPFLRTGDLGFVRGGNLYVSGRSKEMLIIRGRNLFPQDIEASVNACDPDLRQVSVAAVGLGDHEHELGLLVELPRRAHARRSELRDAITQAVTQSHGVAITRLEFVPPRSLPYTSSGKLQRRLARQQFLELPLVPTSTENAMSELYDPINEYFAKLEGRTTNYRFDLEQDVAWSRLCESGLYFTPAVLEPGGIDLDALARIDGAAECFQWALAIAICEEFVALEQRILGFLRTEQAAQRLPSARSTELFDDEEVKHVQLFRRYADALKAMRPEVAAKLDEHLLRSFETAWWHGDSIDRYPSAAVYHFVNWLHFVYFEEYSIHLHTEMRHDPRVQPAWLSAHAAHMREERQHVITDAAYLDRLRLDGAQRREWSKWFLQQSGKDASGLAGLEGVWTFMCEQFPAVDRLDSPLSLLGDVGLRKRAFARLLSREGAFARTLAAAPGFEDFVAELEQAVAEKSLEDDGEPASALELELRDRLRGQIAAALNMPPEHVAIDQALIHFGLDSVAAVQIVADLERSVGVELPPTLLFEQPDVRGLAKAIAELAGGCVTAKTPPKAPSLPTLELDDEIFSTSTRGAQRILLTGATGFLCSHLLAELLDDTDDRVICLVRADDEAHARERLRETLIMQSLDLELAERVEIVVGDVGRPLLGLDAVRFRELAERIDVIYHGAAYVDFVRPYAQLEAANVLGTQEIIRLAAAGRRGPTPLNLISTIGIFDTCSQRGDRIIHEHDVPEHESGFRNGYGHSKWAAEQLAIQARRRGLPLRIFRPGVVCGSTRTGAWQPDMVAALLKSFVDSGVAIYPPADGSLDAAPVDYVAKAIVHIARRADTLGEIFHLNNPTPTPWRVLYHALAQLGHPVELVDYGRWLASLTGPLADPAMLPYAAYFKTRDQAWKLRQASFDTTNTRVALVGSGISCPTIDASLLARYLDRFRKTGFLRPTAISEGAAAHVG